MIQTFEFSENHSFRYFRFSRVLVIYLEGIEVNRCMPSLPLFAESRYSLTDEELSDMGIECEDGKDLLIVKI